MSTTSSGPAPGVRSLCDAGLAAYGRGAFEQAARCFAAAVVADPDCSALWANLGAALLSSGDAETSTAALARAAELAPESPETRYNLGAALRRAGEPVAAAAAYADAIALGLETPEAFNNLGLCLADDGRLDLAIAAYERALSLGPSPAVWVNLGNALGEDARREEAIRCYEAALAEEPEHVAANYDLFAALFDEAAPQAAEQCLERVLRVCPEHVGASFQRAALQALRSGRAAATPALERLPPSAAHLVESLDFVLAHRSRETRLFTDAFRLLDHAASAAASAGLVLELGVRRGASTRFLAARLPDATIHGFDSFEGLPEPWRGVPAGSYSTRGELPEVPSNVVLHPGWFSDTLPSFAAQHEGPIRLLNVDCDLYSSTREALSILGPRLRPGSVVVFDEYLCNPGWAEDEHRALQEVAAELGLSYSYLAFSLFSRQAAIRVR
jgi:tetratricopeptide (TPR) repeat protein